MFVHCVTLTYSPHWRIIDHPSASLINDKFVIGISNFRDVMDTDIVEEINTIYIGMISEAT